jgi:hypothetical protein
MYFRPVAPSHHLKMHPSWDTDAQDLADRIRGKVKQGTFWRVAEDFPLGPPQVRMFALTRLHFSTYYRR